MTHDNDNKKMSRIDKAANTFLALTAVIFAIIAMLIGDVSVGVLWLILAQLVTIEKRL